MHLDMYKSSRFMQVTGDTWCRYV